MKRQCSESENHILRDLISQQVSNSALSKKDNRSYFLFVPAFALGLLLAWPIGLSIRKWPIGNWEQVVLEFVFYICIFIMELLCFSVWHKWRDNRSGKKQKRILSESGTFQINGGTVIDCINDEEDGLCYILAEDDLLDSYGTPYTVRYPIHGREGFQIGERILLIYDSMCDYIAMPINSQTAPMIPRENPAYFDRTDWSACQCLPHPNAAKIDKTNYTISPAEISSLRKHINNRRNIKAKRIIGTILLSLILLFVFAVFFCILLGTRVITSDFAANTVVAGLLILWFLLSSRIPSVIKRGNSKFLGNVVFKKRVLYCSQETNVTNFTSTSSTITVYEHEGGSIIKKHYPEGFNVFLPRNIRPGTVITKLSTDGKHKLTDATYFVPADI